MAGVGTTNFDCLEIKTRSIEQTLLPLIKQVIKFSCLVELEFIWDFCVVLCKFNILRKWVCTLTLGMQ